MDIDAPRSTLDSNDYGGLNAREHRILSSIIEKNEILTDLDRTHSTKFGGRALPLAFHRFPFPEISAIKSVGAQYLSMKVTDVEMSPNH